MCGVVWACNRCMRMLLLKLLKVIGIIFIINFSSMLVLALAIVCGSVGFLFWAILNRKRRPRMDATTLRYLAETEQEPKECITSCLNTCPISKDEKTCAEQMRTILKAGKLSYRTLETQPELLLLQSKYVGDFESYGALWTRFTVQYNLFGGSIVAMGDQMQRDRLYNMQSSGALGCFAFTECGAGVLSGAVMETTAVYDKSKRIFIIHSPTLSSKKKWISQGVFAEYAVSATCYV
jgi:alkylation response protein AidB-like acyl-CoA dehydrogenase